MAKALDARALPTGRERTRHTGSASFGRCSGVRTIVHALQSHGAYRGDDRRRRRRGVLALKDADIGVAMGSGSPASRAVAQIVLLNSSLPRCPCGRRGRQIHRQYQTGRQSIPDRAIVFLLLALLVGIECLIAIPRGVICCSVPADPRHHRGAGLLSGSQRSSCPWRPTTRAGLSGLRSASYDVCGARSD